MRAGQVCATTGASPKALRYWESLGLLAPEREANGYRRYRPEDLAIVTQLRELAVLGVPVGRARPFLDCAEARPDSAGDDCPEALATYRRLLRDLDDRIAALVQQRDSVQARLRTADGTAGPAGPLPSDLPEPRDDGAADHLPGCAMPAAALTSTDGERVHLDRLGPGRTILYCYPLTGRADIDLPDGWDAIPGARGCTEEACDFRDHHRDLIAAGAARVHGLSTQTSAYQAELVERLRLPFTMLSDPDRALGAALALPTFTAGEQELYRRQTLVVRDGHVEHVFYPVFPPDRHAAEVVAWLDSTRPRHGERG